jgi:hypothetical protein
MSNTISQAKLLKTIQEQKALIEQLQKAKGNTNKTTKSLPIHKNASKAAVKKQRSKKVDDELVETIDNEGDICYLSSEGDLNNIEDRHYEVKKILDDRMKNGKREFLVEWKGVQKETDRYNWVVEQSSFKELIQGYLAKEH